MKKKIILFGIGKNVENVKRQIVVEPNIELLFCDNDIAKQEKKYDDVDVVGAEQVFEWDNNNLIEKIIITTRAVGAIFEQCILGNVSENKLFYWDYERCMLRKATEWYSENIFSQDGEEIYLKSIFKDCEKGFYVDIGANHPFRFSNTKWAYERGWNGINIEPDSHCHELLKCIRKRDINLQVGISEMDEEKEFYVFQESALNTFDKQEAKKVAALEIYGNYEISKCTCRRLETLFDKYQVQHIDLMDIDVEGMELSVLQSIKWEKVSIDVILVEQKNLYIDELVKSDIYKFLFAKGYRVKNKFNRTTFYEKESFACP